MLLGDVASHSISTPKTRGLKDSITNILQHIHLIRPDQPQCLVRILAGFKSDQQWVKRIAGALDRFGISWTEHYASANRYPRRVLELLDEYLDDEYDGVRQVIITVAGMSSGLSGMVAANCNAPVLACPPLSDNLAVLTNIQSTLQMPRGVPVMTVLSPENCAECVHRMFGLLSPNDT